MPNKISVPAFARPSEGYKVYQRFRGVDYSTDETQLDDSRSPRAVNLISDSGGYPEKRLGWRTLATIQTHKSVNGIFPFLKNGVMHLVVHCGDDVWKLTLATATAPETAVKLQSAVFDGKSHGFYVKGALYLLTGREYLRYDGEKMQPVRDTAYVPTTTQGAKPTGGGDAYERVNMLTPKRKNLFSADGTATAYTLDARPLDAGCVVKCEVSGAEVTAFTVDYEKGIVSFASAPQKPLNPGTDNVRITFSKTVAGAAQKIEMCTTFAMYGLGSDNRVFLSGNSTEAASEWYSGLSDPTYFPDINFITVGSSDFPILCYLKYQGELMVIKKDNRQEATVWNHTAETAANGTAMFPLREGVSGVGAVASMGTQLLLDDPLFVSPNGIFAPVTTYNGNKLERNIQRRSTRIDVKLRRERNLKDAISTVWNGYYILAMDGHAYVADANQERTKGGYEWYYWENIPATCFATESDDLYFGTADGRVCRFNDDLIDEHGNILMRAYNDDNAHIAWEWRSKLDDFGFPSRYKTLDKRGNAVHLKAFTNSECSIQFRTERDFGSDAITAHVDRMTFTDVDFKRFTFNTLKDLTVVFKIKAKNFKRGQIILSGCGAMEGFGIYSAALHYTIGDYAKANKQR